ncbi:MAG: LptF/LptG family permease [Acidobacteriota bacterium]|nr:LptF/LptG family permease [Acidobacteriota bacterium]
MRTLYRYVFRELLGPFTLGAMVFTFLLLLQLLFNLARLIIVNEVPVGQVGLLLARSLPNIVVLTIPMGLLFGILVGMGRLAADSELTAIRAAGISLLQLYRPILRLSSVMAVATAAIYLFVLPWTNSAVQLQLLEIAARSPTKQVQARQFFEEWVGKVLYVFDAPADEKRWYGVFLAEDLPTGVTKVTTARAGELRLDVDNDRLLLVLEDAVVHEVDLENPGRYPTTSFQSSTQVLEDQFTSKQREKFGFSKDPRSMSIAELLAQRSRSQASPMLQRTALAELHKRFAIPVICLVFALLALPLAASVRRTSGRSSGFALSVGIIVLYWVLLANGEEGAVTGRWPVGISIWFANILFTALGLLLLWRRNSDRSLFGALRWLSRKVRPRGRSLAARARRPRGARSAASGRPSAVTLRLPSLGWGLPNLLDRYVFRTFVGVFALVQLSLIAVFMVANLTETMDEILRSSVGKSVVVDYYKYLSLQVFYDVAPIAVLLTTLVTFGLLSRSNEVTAAKALGISLYRLSIPAAVAAAGVTLVSFGLQAAVLPASNQKVARLKDQIWGAKIRTYRRADRNWLFGQGRYIYNYRSYDPEARALNNLQVFEFDADTFELTRRLYSSRAQYIGDAWLFEPGWTAQFSRGEVLDFTKFDAPSIDAYPETPEYFESELRLPDAMSYRELEEYIAELEGSGRRVPEMRIQLYKKISFPVICFVMALVALPFSFRLGRRGALYGAGFGVVLGMVFFAVFAFCTTLGETGALPPLAAVWSPNLAFALCAVYLFLGLET